MCPRFRARDAGSDRTFCESIQHKCHWHLSSQLTVTVSVTVWTPAFHLLKLKTQRKQNQNRGRCKNCTFVSSSLPWPTQRPSSGQNKKCVFKQSNVEWRDEEERLEEKVGICVEPSMVKCYFFRGEKEERTVPGQIDGKKKLCCGTDKVTEEHYCYTWITPDTIFSPLFFSFGAKPCS